MNKNMIRLRCGKSIIPSQEVMIDKILIDLVEKATARLVLLIDTSGQVISFQGDRGNTDLVALGALAAADLAASQEIARLSDIYQDNQVIIRQGTKVNTIIHEVGRDLILLVIVPTSVPLGWFSYLVRHTTEQIHRIVETTSGKMEEITLDTDVETLAANFNSALDNILKE